MGIRTVRTEGDECLRKVCKPVKSVSLRTRILIEDMFDTMYEANGVGLAAPQVGILKQICVIDVTPECDHPIVLVNPEIIELSGEQIGQEGCLSVPGKVGIVKRANYAKVKALDENMNEIIVEGEELLARALQHEIDHLSGTLYVSKTENGIQDVEPIE